MQFRLLSIWWERGWSEYSRVYSQGRGTGDEGQGTAKDHVILSEAKELPFNSLGFKPQAIEKYISISKNTFRYLEINFKLIFNELQRRRFKQINKVIFGKYLNTANFFGFFKF